jgi:hypothetical protein
MHSFEDWSLLDVKFQIGCCVSPFGGSFSDLFDLDVALTQSIFEANTIAVSAVAVGSDCVGPGERGGAEETAAEASTLFVCPVDDANRDRRPALKLLGEAAQHLKSGENAKAAV